ncbi:hypothetical protein GCM10009117_21670 [Gangjinia marincola]|uniref:PhoD-like phosphatase metallophosphatase domain-containing protein n=2 Tax=Gangjinia marincola TaxID=578463 RepID=A0ABP3XUE0_9FLAO
MTSIQLLSNEHGWETWGNFPHEQERFYALLTKIPDHPVVVLSGDRHLSEFSKKTSPAIPFH